MTTMVLALSVVLGSRLAALQQDGWSETSFHRIHLRNGNFIDGKVISDKPGEVILLLKSGELTVRRDQIDQVEIVKMRSWNEKPIILESKNKPPTVTPNKSNPDITTHGVHQTPIHIRTTGDHTIYKR